MTRAGHTTSALAIAFTGLCLDPSLHGLAMAGGLLAGANLPDDLEFPLRVGGVKGPSLVPHRSLTHWPWSYLIIAVLAVVFLPLIWGALVAGIALGALVHLAIDACSPHGIPWINPLRAIRPTRPLYRTWTVSEWMIIGPLLAIATIAGLARPETLHTATSTLTTTLAGHFF